jgi:hypothetical protein
MNVDEEVLRFARLLESVVRVSKVSIRELERRLDLGGGSLNRIFSGRIELKLRHILLVLDTLGLDPKQYFITACDQRPGDELPRPFVGNLVEALKLLAPVASRPEREMVAISDSELDRRIREALRRIEAEARKAEKESEPSERADEPPSPPRKKPAGKGKPTRPRGGQRSKGPKKPKGLRGESERPGRGTPRSP